MKRPFSLAAFGIACAATPCAFGQQFTYNAAALPAQSIWTNGVAIADLDGDGDRDIAFANGSSYGSGGAQAQHLFLNNGSGTFVAAHAQLNVANFNAQMVIAEDFDGDSDLDLLYAPEGAYPATTQLPRMLINNGSGTFSDQSATRIPAVTMASFCVAAGDVDNDGDLDVAFTDGATFGGAASQCRLYLNNGSGFFTNATATNMPVDTYNAQDVTFADWEGDLDVDIVLTGKGGAGKQSRLYLNNGSGIYTVDNRLNASGSGNTYEGDPSDLDGDGDMDIAMQSISGFAEGWVRNNGAGAVTNTNFSGTNGDDDNEMASLDFDNDGDLDVFVGSLASTEKCFRQAAAVFTRDNTVIQAQADSSLDIGFGDLDGDGDYDMVTAQGESGNFTDKVYRNNGTADNRVPVLVGSAAPASLTGSNLGFRALLRDALVDDGRTSANARLIFATNDASGGNSGVATALDMGTGLFRAGIPGSASTTQVSYCWIGSDQAGNLTQFGGTQNTGAGANGWAIQGAGTLGQRGVPVFAGAGALAANTAGHLDLFDARPNSLAILMIGLAPGNAPLLGGVLVPFPIIAQVNLLTNGVGELGIPFVFPAGLPGGTNIYLQYLVQDAANPNGVAFSNGLRLTAQ